MERLERVVIQLEECKRFILAGREPYLRLALLLLDNAAEILMHRKVTEELQHDDFYVKLHRVIDGFQTSPAEKEDLRKQLGYTPLSEKRKKAVAWSFEEKTKFLSQEKKYIPEPAARVLSYLHRYRNEAYHRDHVRPDSIRPATLLLFEVVCDLLTYLPAGSWSYSSNGDYSWLAKYGVNAIHNDNQGRGRIIVQLKEGLPLDIEDLRTSLAAHLNDRIDEIVEGLGFIAEPKAGEEETLKALQLWSQDRTRNPYLRDQRFHDFKPRYTMASLQRWREQIADLSTIGDKLVLFERFSDLEQEIEPLETLVSEVVAIVDEAAQLADDIARGK
jgi:hypothetical protein